MTTSTPSRNSLPGDVKTFGLWIAFPFPMKLRREGITRFFANLVGNLLKNSSCQFEIWCYHLNLAEMRAAFEPATGSYWTTGRIRFVTEQTYSQLLPASEPSDRQATTLETPPLELIANQYSKAEVFMVTSPWLESALYLQRRRMLYLPDLVSLEFPQLFKADDPQAAESTALILAFVHACIRQNVYFCCNSEHVRQNHLVGRVPGINDTNSHAIYLPVILPDNLQSRFVPRTQLTERFGIRRPYLFYPTQFRPYKNVTLLLRALRRLLDEGCDLQLVLTGKPQPNTEAQMLMEDLKLQGDIVLTGDVSEIELYSLHREAAATVVPTLFEGGFPWQALEAVFVGTPAVLANIPVVRERLKLVGIAPEASGLLLFDPHNENELLARIHEALADRSAVVARQAKVTDAMRQYGWDDVGRLYLDVLTNQVGEPTNLPRHPSQRLTVRMLRALSSVPVIRDVVRPIRHYYRLAYRLALRNVEAHEDLRSCLATVRQLQQDVKRLEQKLDALKQQGAADNDFACCTDSEMDSQAP